MKRTFWVLLATLVCALPAAAQSQFQSTFGLGLGYTRPSVERLDMISALLQAEDFFFETGIGVRTNAGIGGDTVISWLVRGAVRPFVVGNTTGHIGGEFSLHTNSVQDANGSSTLLGLGFLVGVSHPITEHFTFGAHLFPVAFEFGGNDTIAKIGVAELSAHIMF